MIKYNIYTGIKNIKTKTTLVISGVVLSVAGLGIAIAAPIISYAAPGSLLPSFSQSEITTNWTPDRTAPSGGYGSVNYAGRNDVLEMNINTQARSQVDPFYYTEGLQRHLDNVSSVRADLFVESSWITNNTKVRAGLWGVGQNSASEISAYPIVEFTTSGVNNFTGWRVWDGVNGGWTNLNTAYNAGKWNSLEVVFNSQSHQFDFYINGLLAASNTGGDSINMNAVILNSYNYGQDGTNYSVHWHNGALPTKDQCMNNGWKTLVDASNKPFKNQGDCVSYVATNGKNKANG